MLVHLSIKDLAIIDRLEVSFGPGLNILSGETGTGKSIILGAVGLLMGAKAQADLVREGAKEAAVLGLFEISAPEELAGLLAQNGIEPGPEVLLGRVISASGRSRAYVNNRLTTLGLLAELGSRLLSISGQHEAQRLLAEEEHLLLLDRFAGLEGRRAEVGAAFAKASELAAELRRLANLAGERERQVDILAFQVAEIAQAKLEPGEEERLLAEQKRLRHAERLSRGALEIHQALHGAPGSVLEALGFVQAELARLAELDPILAPLLPRVEEAALSLEDAAREVESYGQRLVFDPDRQAEVEERLALVRKLIRKYGQGQGIEAVLARAQAMAEELESLRHIEDETSRLEAAASQARLELEQLAGELSRQRRQAGQKMARAVAAELDELGLGEARFEVEITPREALGPDGQDRVTFMLSTNPGEGLKPLRRVASGGELSRVTLALKTILADQKSVETVVFDEVDAGIGGRVAEVIGRKLRALGGRHQVMCITHLPQIAAFGQSHFRVVKTSSGGRTISRIEALEGEERARELARMLAGAALTEKALAHAREMLASAG